MAVNLYGIERATADIDIVVKLDEENLLQFVAVAKELGLQPKLPISLADFVDASKRRSWITNKNMTVFSLHDPDNPFFFIDIFVEMPFDFDKVYMEREEIEFGNTVIPVVPIKDLIAMKERSDRPQDRADTFHLKKILKDWGHE